MHGGFIGVDIFFVISGFLITGIIFSDLNRQLYSIGSFYARRIRRIFPALLVVISISSVFAWYTLTSDELIQYGKHVAAGSGFISNIILWLEIGYFDSAAETKPLLHLWSLGVEEQFYIFWPWIALLIWRRRTAAFNSILALAVASFVLCMIVRRVDASAAFYIPFTRFWELLIGAAVSRGLVRHERASANSWTIGRLELPPKLTAELTRTFEDIRFRHGLSVVGFVLLGSGLIAIDTSVVFPGAWALLPTLGAAAVIAAGPRAVFNRALSNRLFVWLGLISFPLYLWHWPLLSFARIIEGGTPDIALRASVAGASILLAWATFRFVEAPIRSGVGGPTTIPGLVTAMTLVGAFGFSTYVGDGFPSRTAARLNGPDGDIGHLAYHKYISENYHVCEPVEIARQALTWEGYVRCMQSKKARRVDVALIGDSHAEHLFLGIAEALPNDNVAFYIKGGLPHVGNPDFSKIFQHVISNPSIRHVILATHWPSRRQLVPDGSNLEDELVKTIDLLTAPGRQIYLTDNVPTFGFLPERCKGGRWWNPRPSFCDMDRREEESQYDLYGPSLEAVGSRRPSVEIIMIRKIFCTEMSCSMRKGEELFFRDTNHLNLKGSSLVGRLIVNEHRALFDR